MFKRGVSDLWQHLFIDKLEKVNVAHIKKEHLLLCLYHF